MKADTLSLELQEEIMQRAIQLALQAEFKTDPNPVVGAILVNGRGDVLAEGFHEKAGLPHAEVIALGSYDSVPEDAVLFVTLEPCNHHGKTPPCTELLLTKKVRNVVIGCQDPNPAVSGRGIGKLRAGGVNVTTGVCEAACRDINRVFNKHIVQKIPWVTVKAAISLDGKIAMPSGESQWITGETSRATGHILRSRHQGIAVGRQTLVQDNPRLTDRISTDPRQPVRIVYTTCGDVPMGSAFVQDRGTRRIVISGSAIPDDREKQLTAEGIEVIAGNESRPSITWSLSRLYEAGICSLLIEGGGELIASIIREKAADQLCLFLSGKVIGSSRASAWTGDLDIEKLADVPHLKIDRFERSGEDLMLTCFF